MSVLLVAGVGVVVAGVLAIGFGIQYKEFEVGKTLILVGATSVSTGLIMLSLAAVARELRAIASRLGPGHQAAQSAAAVLSAAGPAASERVAEPPVEPPLFSRDQQSSAAPGAVEPALPMPPALPSTAASAPPWQEEAARSRLRGKTPPAPATGEPEPAPEAKPRRNLLFSSSRRERERTARTADLDGAPSAAPEAGPRTSFEDAWPAAEPPSRSDTYRRSARTPPPPREAPAVPLAAGDAVSPPRIENPSEVTVLKSGVVDGMAYSLYSDGSIEAQLPEGMMRFASIGELRAHLDQRP